MTSPYSLTVHVLSIDGDPRNDQSYADRATAVRRLYTALAGGHDVALRAVTIPLTIQPVGDDDRDDRERLAAAFKSLRRSHVTVLGRFCCSSCMWADAGVRAEGSGKGLVGFNVQSWRSWDDDRRDITSTLWLQHSGDSAAIVDALLAQGLAATWDGKDSSCIAVHPRARGYCNGHGERYYRCDRCRDMDEAKREHRRAVASDAYEDAVAGRPMTRDARLALRDVYGRDWPTSVRSTRERRAQAVPA